MFFRIYALQVADWQIGSDPGMAFSWNKATPGCDRVYQCRRHTTVNHAHWVDIIYTVKFIVNFYVSFKNVKKAKVNQFTWSNIQNFTSC